MLRCCEARWLAVPTPTGVWLCPVAATRVGVHWTPHTAALMLHVVHSVAAQEGLSPISTVLALMHQTRALAAACSCLAASGQAEADQAHVLGRLRLCARTVTASLDTHEHWAEADVRRAVREWARLQLQHASRIAGVPPPSLPSDGGDTAAEAAAEEHRSGPPELGSACVAPGTYLLQPYELPRTRGADGLRTRAPARLVAEASAGDFIELDSWLER